MGVSHLIRFFATPWSIAYQATLSMGFSRQEYWSVGASLKLMKGASLVAQTINNLPAMQETQV